MKIPKLRFVFCMLVVLLLAACQPAPPEPVVTTELQTKTESSVDGVVLDERGPVPGAVVRVQATENSTITDEDGRFTLSGLTPGESVTVSAWKHLYYCAKVEGVVPPASDVALSLILYQTNDNPDYEWILPTGEDSCASCKSGVTQIWLGNAHAGAANNQRFLTMYNGTDIFGNQSPPTRYGTSRDYGTFPLRPDPSKPYYGPGYKLDFPETAGNCAACHTPGAAVDTPYGIDPNSVADVNTFGVHCDFCHKVADVSLDPTTKMPYANMPGVLSMDVRRPFPEDPDRYQLFFGTFDDDNVPEEDTYLPLILESQFCAPCHFGVFWDTVIYNSYGEWLDSPYSDLTFEGAKTCQECHMPAPSILDGEIMTNVAPGTGGVERDPLDIHPHLQLGVKDVEFMQTAVTMEAEAEYSDGQVVVTVTITNDKAGHHIPTDSPLRQMILLVKVTDPEGNPLLQVDGPTVPDWGGVETSEVSQTSEVFEGYYAGQPGTAYAKILQEMWTEVTPTGAYWNPTRILSDNRIPAFGSDTTVYTFQTSEVYKTSEVSVEVKLLFRRAFIELIDQKGWDAPDILMAEETLVVKSE